ncbi:hypothetical protein GYMLUDRAFT_552044 [Collybiopsis luxurians FD-317 M1]|uniref:Uncharacterized protein n=1 Tax=Collybiopsis luxurians FD-317 M1 TaxID=944289 RepID=A0A0D0CHL5_9AGAR|nr:hypothetical protein GYMLUDRAFT_552044 [Collybiopsis luxurians FD-317 M1]
MFEVKPALGQEQIVDETSVEMFCDALRTGGWDQTLRPGCRDSGRCYDWALASLSSHPLELYVLLQSFTLPFCSFSSSSSLVLLPRLL